jgi:ABC transport system ATP-binding/permease protein
LPYRVPVCPSLEAENSLSCRAMIPGIGKEQIGIGSAPDNDVVLAGTAPRHATIVKKNGQLFLVDLSGGGTFVNGQPIPPNQPVPFDFRTAFVLGQVPLPLAAPAIIAMILSPGQAAAQRGQVILGRDAASASLVVASSAVSSLHATVMLDRMMVVDHGSTSGTYVNGQRITPNQPTPLDPNGVVIVGPIPIPVPMLHHFAQAAGGAMAAPVGQPGALAPAPAMQPAQGGPPAGEPRKHRTIIGEFSLQGGNEVISVGRTPENKIVIPHAQVSSHHAQIHKVGDQMFLEDLRSANGTFVRGQRIPPGTRVPVQNGERVYIGPMPLLIQIGDQKLNLVVEDQQASWAGRPLYEVEGWDLYLEVPDRDNPNTMKVLLDHVSFKAMPGDMIALMGPSGAGKTTLLMTLNGYKPPTSGQVRVNGEDLYAVYDALRGSIGYVPQDDLVHPELTVFEAVRYSAKFRLPPDYSEAEINQRVEATLKDLGLESLRNLQIGKPEKKVLSGGQRKRVNIALELVTDPVILFLDEPTSGLAADDTTALITLLADLTKRTGKTIIMTIHQPAKDEYEKFNLTFIMGYGGIPTYFGPTGNASYQFFSSLLQRPEYKALAPHHDGKVMDNPRDMFDMLNVRERGVLAEMKRADPNASKNTARLEAARIWRGEFFRNENPVFQQMYSGRRAVGTETATRGVPSRPSVALISQLFQLMSRYWKVKVRDTVGAVIMFAQAPIIGLMLWFVFGPQKSSVPFWCVGALREIAKKGSGGGQGGDVVGRMAVTTDHSAALFFVVVSCVWFGTSNAAREIVTERAIYMRERMVNLSLFNYVLSKFIPLALICIFQCSCLLGIVFLGLGFHGGPLAFLGELVNMVAVAMSATALGLLLSTIVTSAEAAMALTPIALIPQVVLGGLMVPMTTNDWLKPLMYFMPARWGFEGAIAYERAAVKADPAWLIDLNNPGLTSAPDFIKGGKFECAIAQVSSETLAGGWGFTMYSQQWLPPTALFSMTFLMMIVLLIMLRRRDPV